MGPEPAVEPHAVLSVANGAGFDPRSFSSCRF
jgi:hypothetical protein